MEKFTTPRVLIVGAGAMGIVVGHNLSLAKASVTYLVRPGNVERLGRPQMLYSYNDNTLKAFDDYDVITDHADIAKGRFDYIITTLDGASMQSDDGVELTKAIGKAALGSDIRVIQGALFFDSRRWFQHVSGLPGISSPTAISVFTLTLHVPSPSRSTGRQILPCSPRPIWLTLIAWITA